MYHKNWLLFDFVNVAQHAVINTLIISPLILTVIIRQVIYAEYSLNHPAIQLAIADFSYNPMYIPFYVKQCDVLSLVIFILVVVYIGVQNLFEFKVQWSTIYPLDRSFQQRLETGINTWLQI